MENTILKDQEKEIVFEILLNDNSLLQFEKRKNETKENVRIRYVDVIMTNHETLVDAIVDDYLANMDTNGEFISTENCTYYITKDGDVLEYNQKAIAYYKQKEKLTLNAIYDLEMHSLMTGNEDTYYFYFRNNSISDKEKVKKPTKMN